MRGSVYLSFNCPALAWVVWRYFQMVLFGKFFSRAIFWYLVHGGCDAGIVLKIASEIWKNLTTNNFLDFERVLFIKIVMCWVCTERSSDIVVCGKIIMLLTQFQASARNFSKKCIQTSWLRAIQVIASSVSKGLTVSISE